MSIEAVLTAQAVRRVFLEPSMDARALNLSQTSTVLNVTDDVACLVRHTNALSVRGVSDDVVGDMLRLERELLLLNQEEGRIEMRLAGAAEEIAIDLRDRELNDEGHTVLSVHGAVARLREPLAILEHHERHPLRDVACATAQVFDVIELCTRARVLSRTVERQLGVSKYRTLKTLCEASC